ncbi:hypothetical protein PG997_011991 [Apiospora hydei]|uniref:Uncharacterized protein n=1 Tax=Apiospora hydei TaxID=1337664 RepID=A0ABR1V221_9PEZI
MVPGRASSFLARTSENTPSGSSLPPSPQIVKLTAKAKLRDPNEPYVLPIGKEVSDSDSYEGYDKQGTSEIDDEAVSSVASDRGNWNRPDSTQGLGHPGPTQGWGPASENGNADESKSSQGEEIGEDGLPKAFWEYERKYVTRYEVNDPTWGDDFEHDQFTYVSNGPWEGLIIDGPRRGEYAFGNKPPTELCIKLFTDSPDTPRYHWGGPSVIATLPPPSAANMIRDREFLPPVTRELLLLSIAIATEARLPSPCGRRSPMLPRDGGTRARERQFRRQI